MRVVVAWLAVALLGSGCIGPVESSPLDDVAMDASIQASDDAENGPSDPPGDNPGPGRRPPAREKDHEGPHMVDPVSDEAEGARDITEAWFALESGELVVHWRLREILALERIPDGSCWNMDFWVNETEYWVLYASFYNGVVGATVRNTMFSADRGGPILEMDTYPITEGRLPVEVEFGAPATFTVRYDSAAFPVAEGQSVKLSNSAFSCQGNAGSKADAIAAGEAFVLPASTRVPEGTGNTYSGPGLTGAVVDACQVPEVPQVGLQCFIVDPEDQGGLYDFTSTPPIPWSYMHPYPAILITFFDESGSYFLMGQPGGIPRWAHHFSMGSVVPLVEWEISVTGTPHFPN